MCKERTADEHGSADTRLYKSWSPYHKSYRPIATVRADFNLNRHPGSAMPVLLITCECPANPSRLSFL